MAAYAELEQGRCCSCGFLSRKLDPYVKAVPDAAAGVLPEYFEVPPEDRATGDVSRPMAVPYFRSMATRPACFRHVIDMPHQAPADTVLAFINLDRQCPKWWPYTPGMDPKEHFSELQVMRLEQERREFEQRMEADRRDFESKLDAASAERDAAINTTGRRLAFAGILLALAQVLVGVVALVIARDDPQPSQQPVPTAVVATTNAPTLAPSSTVPPPTAPTP